MHGVGLFSFTKTVLELGIKERNTKQFSLDLANSALFRDKNYLDLYQNAPLKIFIAFFLYIRMKLQSNAML